MTAIAYKDGIIAYGEGAEKIHHAYNKINQAE